MCVCVAARWGACFKNEITQAVGVALVGCVYVWLPGGGLALRMRSLGLSVLPLLGVCMCGCQVGGLL